MVAAIQAVGQALQGAQAVQILQSIQTAVTTAVINSVQIIQQTGLFRNSIKFVSFEGYVCLFFV